MYYLLLLLASTLSALPKRKSRQCTGQKEEQTIHWPKGRADNTLAKSKSRQYTGQKEEQTIHCPKGRVHNGCSSFWPVYCLLFLLASVFSALPFGQCIICSSFWPVYCLLFLLASVLSALPFGQCIVCGRADNTLTKRKSLQYTDQKEEQTLHWPKGRADNTCIVCYYFWSVYCMLFLLVSVLSALPFGQCIVCSSFWPVYCLLFLLVSVLSALPFGPCIVCS
jgi:uncharacterized membrane protein